MYESADFNRYWNKEDYTARLKVWYNLPTLKQALKKLNDAKQAIPDTPNSRDIDGATWRDRPPLL